MEQNRERGRRDLPLLPVSEELRKRGSGPKALSIASCPALLGETTAMRENRAYTISSLHSVAARRRSREDLVQRVAVSQKRRPGPLKPEVVKGVAGSPLWWRTSRPLRIT